MIVNAVKSKVTQYIDAVLSGDTTTCELTRLAVKRHVDDLERQSTEGFPYHFDEAAATGACMFFPVMLCHSIGEYSDMAFELEPWQAFAVWCIFGWKRDDDNTRRFRRLYWSTGRKNGKSTFAAGLAILLACADVNPLTGKPEDVAQIILCATKREQAYEVIYKEIERMRRSSEEISEASTTINKQIFFYHNDGVIRCVGSDKPYDGLNPSGNIKDELHAFSEYQRDFYNTIITAGGSRAQPLDVTTTTAGSEDSTIWMEEYNYVNQVLRGYCADEELFGWVFELDEKDDALDEENWPKANPNLGVSLKWDFLRRMARPAKHSKVALNTFSRYHGNRVVTSTARLFEMSQWAACQGELEDWKQADGVGFGIDLGGRDDLAALGLCAKFKTGKTASVEVDGEVKKVPIYRFECRAIHFIADSCKRDLDAQPFAQWIHEGHLRKCQYPISDLQAATIKEGKQTRPHLIAYDPAGGQHLAEQIEQKGFKIASMAQNYSHFNEPITSFLEALRQGRITHDGDPVLAWCIKNAVGIQNNNGHWMFAKHKSLEKIDGAVALLMAYRCCLLAPARPTGSLFVG